MTHVPDTFEAHHQQIITHGPVREFLRALAHSNDAPEVAQSLSSCLFCNLSFKPDFQWCTVARKCGSVVNLWLRVSSSRRTVAPSRFRTLVVTRRAARSCSEAIFFSRHTETCAHGKSGRLLWGNAGEKPRSCYLIGWRW